jgi:hypothetical protein
MKKIILSMVLVIMNMSTVVLAQEASVITKPEVVIKGNGQVSVMELSNVLPKHYANCISIKDKMGEPIVAGSKTEPFVSCEHGPDFPAGVSEDLKTIEKSDAVDACHKLGITPSGKTWELPTVEEFVLLLARYWTDSASVPPEFKKELQNNYFWTSTVALSYSEDAEYAYKFNGFMGRVNEFELHNRLYPAVVCIGREISAEAARN